MTEITMGEVEEAIVKLSNAMKELNESRMKQDTIVLLLHDATGIGKKDIKQILHMLPKLEEHFLKPKVHHVKLRNPIDP